VQLRAGPEQSHACRVELLPACLTMYAPTEEVLTLVTKQPGLSGLQILSVADSSRSRLLTHSRARGWIGRAGAKPACCRPGPSERSVGRTGMCSPSAVVRAVHVYSTALTVGDTTCVWRTSAMRNMSLSTLSRRAITAQSLMKTVRARFLGWLMRAKMMPCARAGRVLPTLTLTGLV